MSLEKNEIFDDLEIDLNIETITLDDIELSEIEDENLNNSTDFTNEELNDVKVTEFNAGDLNSPVEDSDIAFEAPAPVELQASYAAPTPSPAPIEETTQIELEETPVEIDEPAPSANLGANETLNILQVTPEPEIPQEEALPIPSEDDRLFNQSKALKDAYVIEASTEIISINGSDLDRMINDAESQLKGSSSEDEVRMIDEPLVLDTPDFEPDEPPVETIPVSEVAPAQGIDLNDINDDNFELNIEESRQPEEEVVFTSEPTEEIRETLPDEIPELDLDLSAVTSIDDDDDDAPIALSMDELNNIEVTEEPEEMSIAPAGESPASEPIAIVDEELVEVSVGDSYAEETPMLDMSREFESDITDGEVPVEGLSDLPSFEEEMPVSNISPVSSLDEGEMELEMMIEEPQELTVNELPTQPASEEELGLEAPVKFDAIALDAGSEPELEEVSAEIGLTPSPTEAEEPFIIEEAESPVMAGDFETPAMIEETENEPIVLVSEDIELTPAPAETEEPFIFEEAESPAMSDQFETPVTIEETSDEPIELVSGDIELTPVPAEIEEPIVLEEAESPAMSDQFETPVTIEETSDEPIELVSGDIELTPVPAEIEEPIVLEEAESPAMGDQFETPVDLDEAVTPSIQEETSEPLTFEVSESPMMHEEPEFEMMETPILPDEPVFAPDSDITVPEELPPSASESPVEPGVQEVQEMHDVIDIVEPEETPLSAAPSSAQPDLSLEEPLFEPLETPTEEIVFDSSEISTVMPTTYDLSEQPVIEETPVAIEEPLEVPDEIETAAEPEPFGSISEVEDTAPPAPAPAAHPHELEKTPQRTLVSTDEQEKASPSVEMVPLEEEIEMSQNDFEEIAKIEEAEEFEGIQENEFDSVNISEPEVPEEMQFETGSMEFPETEFAPEPDFAAEPEPELVLESDEHVEIAVDELNEIQSGIQGEAILSEIPYEMDSAQETVVSPHDEPGIHLSHERKAQIIDEKVVSLSDDTKTEVKKILKYLDTLLEDLPEDKIRRFSQSEYYDLYVKILDKLGV
ncbi:MAG: hypothetical protein HPY53_09380 [Brevinematales bacterium]|nr:hypothetical protein [Brevinematales bacterium]